MKSQYTARAKEIIKQRKLVAESKHSQYLNGLRREHTKFCALESKLNSLYFEKARLESQNESLGNLNKQIKDAEEQFENELKRIGINKEKLNCVYHCPLCLDSGQVDGGECVCLKKEIGRLVAGARDGRVTDKADFDIDFSIFGERKAEYLVNYQLIKKVASDYPDINTKIIVFCGGYGSGKSYLASILANVLEQNHHDAIFIKAIRLNEVFLEYHLAPLHEKSSILKSLFSCGMLIIDDLGSESFLNNVTSEYLYRLILEREDKPILITTNLTPQELNNTYGSRVFSRLADKRRSLWLRFESKDLRLQS